MGPDSLGAGMSKLTDGFESKMMGSDDVFFDCYSKQDVEKLLAHTRALEAMLKKHEWKWDGELADSFCLECGRIKDHRGHTHDCELARLLEE